jgi:predicted DNA-binding transcriptional regulator AlpA
LPILSNLERLPDFLTTTEYAALTGVSERTVERWRTDGTGPSFVKLGRRVFYERAAVVENIKASTYRSAAEAKMAISAKEGREKD